VIEDVKGAKTTITSKAGKPTPKTKYPTRFDIDIAKCMFCGLCAEPCPTGAIFHTTRFEGTVSSSKNLVYRYVKPADVKLAEEQGKLYEAQKAAAVVNPTPPPNQDQGKSS
jgi:formate hydrogenlyase subunit 6/NADH:ubiquinone oxidoreductase subunit I